MVLGNLVSGKRIAQASGRELAHLEDSDQARKFLFLPDVLQWRAHTTPDHPLFLLLNAKVSSTSRPGRAGSRLCRPRADALATA